MTSNDNTYGGVHAVLYALFDRDEHLDRRLMSVQVNMCVDAGVAGITVLGLATEVAKLTESERMRLVRWAAEDIAGRVPLSVTIYGNSLAEQAELLHCAEQCGARWVILQPPMVGQYPGAELKRFYARVAALTALPVAIQNAPALMGGRGLGPDEIAQLTVECPNITHLKGEMPVLDVARTIEMTGQRLCVLNGQGGLEMIDNLRAGCRGFILAPDIADHGVAIFRAWQAGQHAQASEAYEKALPSIVFTMRSVEHLVTYGKRIFAKRAGFEVHDRMPRASITRFGEQCAQRHAVSLGRYPRSA